MPMKVILPVRRLVMRTELNGGDLAKLTPEDRKLFCTYSALLCFQNLKAVLHVVHPASSALLLYVQELRSIFAIEVEKLFTFFR